MSEASRKSVLGENFIRQLVLKYPWVKGNPGNANVMFSLYPYNIDGIINVAWINFYKKYPQYEKEDGWLWIIYKKLCGQDLEKTVVFLKELCHWTPRTASLENLENQ